MVRAGVRGQAGGGVSHSGATVGAAVTAMRQPLHPLALAQRWCAASLAGVQQAAQHGAAAAGGAHLGGLAQQGGHLQLQLPLQALGHLLHIAALVVQPPRAPAAAGSSRPGARGEAPPKQPSRRGAGAELLQQQRRCGRVATGARRCRMLGPARRSPVCLEAQHRHRRLSQLGAEHAQQVDAGRHKALALRLRRGPGARLLFGQLAPDLRRPRGQGRKQNDWRCDISPTL